MNFFLGRNEILCRCFFYFEAFLLVDSLVKFELQFLLVLYFLFISQQPIGRFKNIKNKHLRKKPFHLYPRKVLLTIGSETNLCLSIHKNWIISSVMYKNKNIKLKTGNSNRTISYKNLPSNESFLWITWLNSLLHFS